VRPGIKLAEFGANEKPRSGLGLMLWFGKRCDDAHRGPGTCHSNPAIPVQFMHEMAKQAAATIGQS
jgi:hypothetical protein